MCMGRHVSKGSQMLFFRENLGTGGLEVGENGIRPSLRKREMITRWPTPTSWEDVRAFCYLTPFLRRFIPGRAELVKIMKEGMDVEAEGEEGEEGEGTDRKELGQEVDPTGKEGEKKKRA